MENWDDESEEEQVKPAPVVASRKFEGEDEEDDVVDDWDASSDEEAEAPPQPVAPARKKMSLKARIAEREAEKARRLAEDEGEDEESVVDEAEQRRRDKEQQLEIDLANANSLLSGTSISGKALPTEIQELMAFNPKTKEDFEAYSKKIIEAFIKKHQEKPLYATFVEMHVKALAQPLRDVDVRKAASGLTTLANEKQKEQRDKSSGKKKKKPALSGTKGSARVDTAAYEDALDDFGNDDFM